MDSDDRVYTDSSVYMFIESLCHIKTLTNDDVRSNKLTGSISFEMSNLTDSERDANKMPIVCECVDG